MNKKNQEKSILKSLAIFIIVTFIFSWSISFVSDWWFLPKVAAMKGFSYRYMFSFICHGSMMLGPTIGALFVWKFYDNSTKPVFKWGNIKQYLLVAAIAFMIWVLPAIIKTRTDSLDYFFFMPNNKYQWIVVFCEVFLGGIAGLGEELGWCVFLLPLLTPKLGKVKAIIISGILRGAWHLPITIGSLVERMNHGEITHGLFVLATIQYIILIPITGIILGTVLNYIWFSTGSIPLMGWSHQCYDGMKDITLMLCMNYSSSQFANIFGGVFVLILFIISIVLIKRLDSKMRSVHHLLT